MPDSGTILVANIGSTSFKFRLYRMPEEKLLARGGVERIGSPISPWQFQLEGGDLEVGEAFFPDTAAALIHTEEQLKKGLGDGFGTLCAFGFKPVMAKNISGTQVLDARVLKAMEDLYTLFPAHNPPYVKAVRLIQELYPEIPCIGTFETAFYDHMAVENYRYPVPLAWERDYGIRRYGFHGASHRFVTERASELRGSTTARMVSCHLGGSSSLAAVMNGRAINSSWGMTPQSGLPQNNRVGDFDVFAALYAARDLGLGIDAVEKQLSCASGLQGMSGLTSGDVRDLRAAMAAGNEEARIAMEVFVRSIRKYLGQFALEMNGLDVLIFTAGIGENDAEIRAAVCRDLDYLGLKLDATANAAAKGRESLISAPDSRVEVRVIPTHEEIVIARNTWAKLQEECFIQTATSALAAVH